MSKSNSENHTKLNRRQALLLPAATGVGAALADPAAASDSTKAAAHSAPPERTHWLELEIHAQRRPDV